MRKLLQKLHQSSKYLKTAQAYLRFVQYPLIVAIIKIKKWKELRRMIEVNVYVKNN